MPGHVILSHGSDASPQATKVSALARVAEALGWSTERPDYRDDDALGHAGSVLPRVQRLLARIDASAQAPVLAGSSMGAFASALASLQRPVAGLFLIATPGRIPGVEAALDVPGGVPTQLIHGWQDDVCPLDELLPFARQRGLPVLILDGDHRLSEQVATLNAQFAQFLATVGAPA